MTFRQMTQIRFALDVSTRAVSSSSINIWLTFSRQKPAAYLQRTVCTSYIFKDFLLKTHIIRMLDNHPTSRDFKDIYYVTINIRLTATFTLRGKSLNWTKKKTILHKHCVGQISLKGLAG